jgi:tartrate dehydratase beta subunit/fumarate hydratase class I family protein
MANQRSRVQIGAAGSTPSARSDAFGQIFLEYDIKTTMGKGFLAVVAYDAFGGRTYDD